MGAADNSPLLVAMFDLVYVLLNGKTPNFVRGTVFGANLLAISKKNGAVRPIAAGNIVRCRHPFHFERWFRRQSMTSNVAARQVGWSGRPRCGFAGTVCRFGFSRKHRQAHIYPTANATWRHAGQWNRRRHVCVVETSKQPVCTDIYFVATDLARAAYLGLPVLYIPGWMQPMITSSVLDYSQHVHRNPVIGWTCCRFPVSD
jgi:hypothetical protein